MSRIAKVESFMLQMGARTTVLGEPLNAHETCMTMLYDPKEEGFYCAGNTLGSLAGVNLNTGGLSSDAFIIKFDRRRRILWARQFGSTASGDDSFTSLHFDQEGNIVASGYNNRYDLLVAKFSSNGQLIQEIRFPNRTCDQSIYSMGRHFCANIPQGGSQLRVIEVLPDGNITTLIDYTIGSNSSLEGFLRDPAGNFLFSGYTTDSLDGTTVPDGLNDGFLLSLSPAGSVNWIFQRNIPGKGVFIYDMIFSKTGKLVIAGTQGDDTFVQSFHYQNSETSADWITYFDHPEFNTPNSLESTFNDEILVGGETAGDLFEPNSDTGTDTFIARLSGSDGRIIQGRQFGFNTRGPIDNTGDQVCYSLSLDRVGGILCGGSTKGSTAEPRGGTGTDRDIMIWRVGPNLEF